MIERTDKSIRINLSERYSIYKHKDLKLWYLEKYAFGRDYMPYEIYADSSLLKVYKYFKEEVK